MKLGLYIFASLALIVIAATLAYTVNANYYVLEVMGVNFNFPIAFWMILPMLVLFVFTLLHMFFYGFKNYLFLKKWQRDAATLEDALYWSLLNEPKEQKYAIDKIGASASILGKSSLNILDNVEGLTPRLARIVNIIQKIKNGEYVDLKEYKMTKVFTPGNPLLIQNRLNCLESDEKFVENVMRSTSEYSETVQKEALGIFAKKETFTKARKYAKVFDAKHFLMMLKRVTPQDDLGLTAEILNEFVTSLELQCEDYINIAMITKKYFKPDENLMLFREYQSKNEKAQNAYLYLLFEYELLDQVGAFLEEQEENEFIKFRALYQLKQNNSTYKLEDIIDIHSVCAETKFL